MGLPSSPYNSTASFANLSSTSQQYNPYAPSPVNDNNRGLISQNYNNVDVGDFNKNMGIDGEEEGGGGRRRRWGRLAIVPPTPPTTPTPIILITISTTTTTTIREDPC